jgi:hypothetical protein
MPAMSAMSMPGLTRLVARLRGLAHRPAGGHAGWEVLLAGGRLRASDPEGRLQVMRLAGLSRVQLQAEASGPLGADGWWQFFDAEGRLALRCPQGAPGEAAVLDWLFDLPGFDHAAMGLAMAAVRPGLFTVWQRPA